jgi:hypothetical protein
VGASSLARLHRICRYMEILIAIPTLGTAVLVILLVFMRVASVPSRCSGPLLAQASRCRVYRAADGFARDEKFHSPVLLATGRGVVGSHWQAVPEASG